MQINFTELKIRVQKVIDSLVAKDKKETALRLDEARELLEELTDYADNDEDLIELSRYRILLDQLEQKNGN
jgi:polyhydroxyalkanoate synthesis regulator phasin